MRVALVNPGRRFVTNKRGLGYQVPLGLVFIGGPLADAGHQVELFDNDVMGLAADELARRVAATEPGCVLLGHAGSMPAHDSAVLQIRALRRHLPGVPLVYGGLYPTLAHRRIMQEVPEVDIIGRGEGEATAVELVAELSSQSPDLARVRGITWRDADRVVYNPPRQPIEDLDAYRPGWELLNWDDYTLFGFGRTAGMQFSRGCVHQCSFCTQWAFWRRWRHRSPENFVAQLTELATVHGVGFVWLADEFFSADRDAAEQVLLALEEKELGLSLNINMTARSIVDNADLLPLYKRAGIAHVVVGVESLRDHVVAKIDKDNPHAVSRQAIKLLADHGIVSTASMVFGLEDESPLKLMQTLAGLFRLDPDIFNACYATPLPGTRFTEAAEAERIIETDISKWTYRTPVVAMRRLPTWALFWLIKFCEIVFHLRPRALARLLFGRSGGGPSFRMILRGHYRAGTWVVLDEMLRFLHTRPTPRGSAVKAEKAAPRLCAERDA